MVASFHSLGQGGGSDRFTSPADYHAFNGHGGAVTETTRIMVHRKEHTDHLPPEQVADGTYLIDLGFQGVPSAIGSFLLVGDDDLVLVESGPSTTRGNLAKGVRDAGFDLSDVSRIIVTHIHLDHAGAAGLLRGCANRCEEYVQMSETQAV
jgi:glyoxylase-like metal-dependent hydrolase (beta-lactamase superfamily II)